MSGGDLDAIRQRRIQELMAQQGGGGGAQVRSLRTACMSRCCVQLLLRRLSSAAGRARACACRDTEDQLPMHEPRTVSSFGMHACTHICRAECLPLRRSSRHRRTSVGKHGDCWDTLSPARYSTPHSVCETGSPHCITQQAHCIHKAEDRIPKSGV